MWDQKCRKKNPSHVEITSPRLLMFKIGTEIEKVVEIGWYKEEKRKNEEISDLEGREDEEYKRKRSKMGDKDNRSIALGCLSLRECEEIDGRIDKMRTQVEEIMGQWQNAMNTEKRK